MPLPEIAITHDSFPAEEADALILALPSLGDDALEDFAGLRPALDAVGFTGAKGTYARVYAQEFSLLPLAVVGLGDDATVTTVRESVGAGVRQLTGFDVVAVSVAARVDDAWRGAAEGAVLGGYSFSSYKSDSDEKKAKKRRAAKVLIHAPSLISDADLAVARVQGEAVALVKDLVSTPGADQSPEQLADFAVSSTADLPIQTTVWDENALADGGFGGILGVGRGSDAPPRLVRVDYAPESAEHHVALVGKGITFDTGGLSLKPAASMVGMQEDMTGAAEVLAVVRAAAQLELPVRVTAWMCIAENMPSGRATRPGDVLTLANGTTVEVTNTDAEGRLVLADGLVAASRENPDVIVDVATLTGAMIIALGTRHTGIMGEDAAVDAFLRAADRTGELAWALPLPEHMEDELDSRIADMQNANVGNRAAGSLYAGLFLRRFVGTRDGEPDGPRIPWVHLDIAGSSMSSSSAFGFTDKGPTGATTRALIDFVAAGGQVV
ncbi:leucyl aminopeptidase [Microbacterium amylolyticum]|uniref:Probable cytosol aminopeptidase n=1 Tax=Microbacterium amylolyticum TaxID=936337 RepID=A0ABS4ZDW5_9MICO|nr:leucyl aminopeptidase [Microbacterium amylolyticum]MBP2435472.1 leucyl aminopeptidase [Microbacterium amylolyticum]